MSSPGPVSGATPPRPVQVLPEPNARVAAVPNILSDVKTPVKLEGQIAGQNADGTTRVQTPQGNVDIVIAKPPQDGQQVEVTLLPGRPPRQAVVENAPPPAQNTSPAPANTPAPSTNNPAPPRTVETPVNVEVSPPATTPAQPAPAGTNTPQPPTTNVPVQSAPPVQAPAPPVPVIAPDAVVTVLPLTPAQEAAIVVPPNVAIETTIIPASVTSAQTLPPPTVPLQAPILPTPGLQTSPFLNAAPSVAVSATPVLNVPAAPGLPNIPILQNTAPSLGNITQGPQITAPVQTETHLSQTLQSTITLPGTSSVLTPDVKTLPDIFTAPIQVQIKSITPPPVNFTLPLTQDGKPNLAALVPPQGITDTPLAKTGIIAGALNQKPVLTLFSPQGVPVQNVLIQATPEFITPGTQIQIAMPSPPVHVDAMNMTLPPALPLSFLTPETWPLLEQITQILAQAGPQAAQIMANITPSPTTPQHFGPAALFFLAAVRAGDLGAWMGEKTMDILRRADPRGGILSRMNQETGALNRLSSEPISNEWRAVSLPLYYQGEMQKMALYYRHEEEGGAEGAEKNAFTRFIFDLNLSRMGKVQLDGLFRPKKLDVIIRTEKNFAPQTQMQMRRTYTDALEQTDLAGELSFQSRPDQFMSITPTHKDIYSSAI